MALIGKKSLTGQAKDSPEKYILIVDEDLITLFIAMRTTPSVTHGVVAPTSTPRQVGDIYVDTLAKKTYSATGIASSADWTALN